MRVILRWCANVLAILLVMYVLPGVQSSSVLALLAAAVVLAVFNTSVRSLFRLLVLPLNVLTLGLFTFVVNLALIEILDWVLDTLQLGSLWWALLLALALSVVTPIVNIALSSRKTRTGR